MKSETVIKVYKRKKLQSLDKNERLDSQNFSEGFLCSVHKRKKRIQGKNGLDGSNHRNSFKIIPYPTNHFNCWVSPLRNETTNNLFLNSILKVKIKNHEAIKPLTKQQIICRMKEQSSKWQKIKEKPRFQTQPIHTLRPKQLKEFEKKFKDNRENFKVTRIFLENNQTEPSIPPKKRSNYLIRQKD